MYSSFRRALLNLHDDHHISEVFVRKTSRNMGWNPKWYVHACLHGAPACIFPKICMLNIITFCTYLQVVA